MSDERRESSEHLILDESPVRLTRGEWAADVRRGLTHRIAGQRFVIRLDQRRGVRIIAPVILVERRLAA